MENALVFRHRPINVKTTGMLIGTTFVVAVLGFGLLMNKSTPPPPNSGNAGQSQDMGGAESAEDWADYGKRDTIGYADKGGHRDRSIANAPQHKKHWKKVDKKP